jgi:hypothetical protein
MDILRRGAPAAKEINADGAVHQRIEVTVEREVVSMLVRGQPQGGAQPPAGESTAPEAELPELPAPAQGIEQKERK